MLFKYLSITGAYLLQITRITLASDFGCFGGEKFTDLQEYGDLNGTMDTFCSDHAGSHELNKPFGGCYNVGDHSVEIEIIFGDYPNPQGDVDFSFVTCSAVLRHVKTSCTTAGGKLLVSYVNGVVSHDPISSKRRTGRGQAIDGKDGASAEDNVDTDDELNEHNQSVVNGHKGTVTSTVISITTITSGTTTITPHGDSPVAVTGFYVITSTVGGKKHKITKTEIETSSTTATATTISTATVTASASTSSSVTSPTSSTSSSVDTDDFHGWVRVDPNKNHCSTPAN